MLKSLEARASRVIVTGLAAAVGIVGLAGCSIERKNPSVNAETGAAMRAAIQPTAEDIARVILSAYQNNNNQYFYSSDKGTPGGQEITVDLRDDSEDVTLTADMKADAKGNLLPSTVYRAEIDRTNCHDYGCGSANWDVVLSDTDSFYSDRDSHDIDLKVWNAEEDLYALWDTNKLIDKSDSHLSHPGHSPDSSSTLKELQDARQIVHDAKIALDAAALDTPYGYGRVGTGPISTTSTK